MNNYDRRWNAVANLFKKVNYLIDSGIVVMYDDVTITKPFHIDCNAKEVSIKGECSTYVLYSGNPEYDEG